MWRDLPHSRDVGDGVGDIRGFPRGNSARNSHVRQQRHRTPDGTQVDGARHGESQCGVTELWEFYNTTEDAHPMHVRDLLFEVVNRKGIVVDEATDQVHIPPGSAPTGPELRETGSKETAVRVMPEQSGQPMNGLSPDDVVRPSCPIQ